MNIIPLGIGGWIPNNGRDGVCFAFQNKKDLLLLDLGTGIKKLMNKKHEVSKLIEKHNEIHIVLSHFHLDHIIGLSFLPAILSGNKVFIYGPGEILGQSTYKVLNDFLNPCLFSTRLDDMKFIKEINELKKGKQSIGSFQLEAMLQKHGSSHSLGFNIDNQIAFITDTYNSGENAKFINDCTLLIHECWGFNKSSSEKHSTIEDIQNLVHKTNIKKVFLIHLNPNISNFKYNEKANEISNDIVYFLFEEGKIYSLSNLT